MNVSLLLLADPRSYKDIPFLLSAASGHFLISYPHIVYFITPNLKDSYSFQANCQILQYDLEIEE